MWIQEKMILRRPRLLKSNQLKERSAKTDFQERITQSENVGQEGQNHPRMSWMRSIGSDGDSVVVVKMNHHLEVAASVSHITEETAGLKMTAGGTDDVMREETIADEDEMRELTKSCMSVNEAEQRT
mmetsp:Transcript_23256/g.38997  ORF Transcript_23256/g.38997 Transcript_23256/m.38997 type:complete len:127 (-) Transcript_23256:211-591(-)